VRKNPITFRATAVLAIVVLFVGIFTIRLIDIQVINLVMLHKHCN